jgi:beta-alanine--pyruvate transaminase
MPGVAHMRHTWLPENRYTIGQPETGAELAEDLQRFVDLYGASTIAACVVEPIAGSTGVLVPPKGYLERLRQICDKHGILLVFDEVICGLHRQGLRGPEPGCRLHQAKAEPALSPGAGVSERIYSTIVEMPPPAAPSSSTLYLFRPSACAAGTRPDIYEREGLFERAAELSPHFSSGSSRPGCEYHRYPRPGLLAGFDLALGERPGRGHEATKKPSPPACSIGYRRSGILRRPSSRRQR